LRIGGRFGTWLEAEPFCIRLGAVRVWFHAIGQGLGQHERGSGLQFAAEQACRTGGLEPQGPPGLAMSMEFGELDRAAGLCARP
jgi:hypothetical protein